MATLASSGDRPPRRSRRRTDRWLSEVKGILALAIAGFGLIALATFDPSRPPAGQQSPVGPVGVWLGWAAFQSFGYAGFLFPLLLGAWGASAFVRPPVTRGVLPFTGLAVLLVSAAGLPPPAAGAAAGRRGAAGGRGAAPRRRAQVPARAPGRAGARVAGDFRLRHGRSRVVPAPPGRAPPGAPGHRAPAHPRGAPGQCRDAPAEAPGLRGGRAHRPGEPRPHHHVVRVRARSGYQSEPGRQPGG